MKQFYETYKDNEFVSPLVTQISWTNHLVILSATKSIEEKEFYLKLCIKEKYSKRELQRQLDSGYFERYMLSTEKLEPVPLPKVIKDNFLDTYVLEFLNLPERFSEYDFKKAIISNLKNFILEITYKRKKHSHKNTYRELFKYNSATGHLSQSIVANMYVERALKKEKPLLIVASSTNNQAVTNIIEAFGKINTLGYANLEERWIEGATMKLFPIVMIWCIKEDLILCVEMQEMIKIIS